jgi:uncharacterized protein (UPF0264 family)
MTQLLVSVRNVSEARAALRAGAALLDIKEPARGSLGRAAPRVIAGVVGAAAGRAYVSAALGELADWLRRGGRVAVRRSVLCALEGVQFAKWGLAGCRDLRDWPRHWSQAAASLPAGTWPVAVVYADWHEVGAPQPEHVLDQATAVGCRAALLDTCRKDGRHLLHVAALHDVQRFVDRAHRAGLLAVVAGSLTLQLVPSLLQTGPDYLAVRGAVCSSDRTGRLQGHRVAEWVEALRGLQTSLGTQAKMHADRCLELSLGAHASTAIDLSPRLA